MASLIVSNTDFTEAYSIATDVFTSAELDAFIELNEKKLLYELFGVELADLFIADLSNGQPQTQRFIDVFALFYKQFDDTNNEIFISEGIKTMLVKYIYFIYARQQSQNNAIMGNVQSQSTINNPSAMNYATLVLRYNEMIDTFNAIQQFIDENKSVYPEYKGVCKNYITLI